MHRRYAWAAISEWQCHQGMTQGGRLSQAPARGAPTPERQAFRRSRSVACMTQLQAKQKYGSDALSSDSEAPASPDRSSSFFGSLTRACTMRSLHNTAVPWLQCTVQQLRGPHPAKQIFPGPQASIVLASMRPCDHRVMHALLLGLVGRKQVGCRGEKDMV